MKPKCLAAFLGMLILIVVSGCAFSVHQTPLNYTYSGQLSNDGRKAPTKSLASIDIKDARDVTTPKMIMHMYNAHGIQTSGGWEAEKPIAVIVGEALGEGFKLRGLRVTPNGELSLSGEIVDFSGRVKAPGYLDHVFSTKLTVKLQLRNEMTKRILWRDTFIGQGTVNQTAIYNGKYAKDSFVISLDDLVTKVITDELFLQHVE
jgi:hypothetical protein